MLHIEYPTKTWRLDYSAIAIPLTGSTRAISTELNGRIGSSAALQTDTSLMAASGGEADITLTLLTDDLRADYPARRGQFEAKTEGSHPSHFDVGVCRETPTWP